MLSSKFRDTANIIIVPIAKIFALFRISPIHLTFLGLVCSLATGFLFYYSELYYALLFLALGGFFDAIDGAVARVSNKSSELGAFFDSVMDRYADGAVVIGLSLYLEEYFLGMLALVGGLMVSYTRTRAEHFIPKCDMGLGERAERLLVIIFALAIVLAGGYPVERGLYLALVLVTLLAFSTALERFSYTYFRLKGKRKKKER